MIIWMHGRLCAKYSAKFEIGSIRNHFVDVHVGLRARPGLPHQQREMPVHFAVGDILGHRRNGRCTFAVERAERSVDLGCRALDHTECVHDLDRHALCANAEIM